MKSKSKDKVIKWAVKQNRKVLWKDDEGYWHAATNKDNTPLWASEVMEISK